jgi:hypothetical protein
VSVCIAILLKDICADVVQARGAPSLMEQEDVVITPNQHRIPRQGKGSTLEHRSSHT